MNQHSPGTNPQEANQAEVSTETAAPLVVRVPVQLPVLTEHVSRALLALLAEVTKIGVLDGPLAERRSRVD